MKIQNGRFGGHNGGNGREEAYGNDKDGFIERSKERKNRTEAPKRLSRRRREGAENGHESENR